MLLTGLAFRPSDLSVSNDTLIDAVLEHSRLDQTGAERVARTLQRLLDYSGASHRYWTGSTDHVGERIASALDAALARAGLHRGDIDLVISTSVDRSVLEPAHAYNLTALLGMYTCPCFDVTDGCNAWLRAMQLSQALLQSHTASRIAVISSEFTMMPTGSFLPSVLQLDSLEALRTSFPPLTLGDGVAVTIVEAGGAGWDFAFASRSDLVDLCYAPLPESGRYRTPDARRTWRTDTPFVVDGAGLFREAARAIPKLLAASGVDPAEFDDVIVHGATSRQWQAGAREVGDIHTLRNAFPHYGNVVSASIPAALASDVPFDGANRQVLAIGASAGMSFALAQFEMHGEAVDPTLGSATAP
ncbi:hypothetical protein BH23ACT10_BH23ACT10_27930 [soil metagenome]